MKLRTLLTSVAISATMFASAASATDYNQIDYVTGYVGYFNVLDSDDNAGILGAEYRFSATEYGLRPIVGVFGTSEGSAYGYAGVNWDVAILPDELYLIPNFAVGAYSDGGGKDLGGVIEFRSGIEIAYQLQNEHRIGVAFNHLSNASIYDKNPGTETLLLNYSVPSDQLF